MEVAVSILEGWKDEEKTNFLDFYRGEDTLRKNDMKIKSKICHIGEKLSDSSSAGHHKSCI